VKGFSLETFLHHQLVVAADRVSRKVHRLFRARFGISVPEWRVLAHLGQVDAVSVREIHARVDMDKSKVSRAAARLEAQGYVTKKVHPTDRRLVELTLTEAGRAILDELLDAAREVEAHITAEIGEGVEDFQTALLRLIAKG
jgi:DNA-binding MarR family transcriptional regulator